MGIKSTATFLNNKLHNKEEPSSVFPDPKTPSPHQPEGMSEAISSRLIKLNEENKQFIRDEFAKSRAYFEATLSAEDFRFIDKEMKHGNA